MRSTKTLIIAIALAGIITLSGCGTKNAQSTSPQSSTQVASTDKNSSTEKKKFTSIDDASENMRNLLKDMKSQVANKEEDKAIKTSDKLEENWSSFEDIVKGKNPALYEKVEKPLDTIEAGVKVKPIDVKTITASTEELDKVLTELQNLK